MAAQLEPSKMDRFSFPLIFKAKDSKSEVKQSKIPSMKNNVSKMLSTMTKSFRKAGRTEISSVSLPALSPKAVEFLPMSREMSPKISKIFPELNSPTFPVVNEPSPKMKEVRNDVEEFFVDLVLPSQRRDELPPEIVKSPLTNSHKLSLTTKQLCSDSALLSAGLNQVSPEIRSEVKSESCLQKKRNDMPEIFLFPPEISPASLEVEQVKEQAEFWPDILSPSPTCENISAEITKLSPPEGYKLSSKNDELGPNSPLLSPILEVLSSNLTSLSPKGGELSLRPRESCSKKQSVTPDFFVFPPAPCEASLQNEPKIREKVKIRRYQSAPSGSKEPHRARIVSEPCGNMYTQLMAKQGAKLTNAAHELTEEQSRSLYEDMFKPLDVFSLIQKRSRNANQKK